MAEPADPLVARSSDLQGETDSSEAEPIDLQDMAIRSRYLDGKEIVVNEEPVSEPVADFSDETMLPPLEQEQAVITNGFQDQDLQSVETERFVPRADHSRLVKLDMRNGKIERMDAKEAAPASDLQPLVATTVSGIEPAATHARNIAPVETVSFQKSWQANEGDSIRSVLQGWAASENIELVWDSMNEFAVLGTFTMDSSFEAAVQGLLDQYLEGEVRPVARLHYDPSSQDKILIVQVEGL